MAFCEYYWRTTDMKRYKRAGQYQLVCRVFLVISLFVIPIATGDAFQVGIYEKQTSAFPLISLFLTVIGQDGNPVSDLSTDNVTVMEDGQTYKGRELEVTQITELKNDEAPPMNIAIVVDNSLSMRNSRSDIKQAIASLLPRLTTKDHICLIVFEPEYGTSIKNNDEAEVKLNAIVWYKLTSDKEGILQFLDNYKSTSDSPLYDALVLAVKELQTAKNNGRPAVLLFSDGNKEGGVYKFDATMNMLKMNGVPVFAIVPGNKSVNLVHLKKISQETGGRDYADIQKLGIEEVYTDILKFLKSQYRLSFKSKLLDPFKVNRKVVISITLGENRQRVENDILINNLLIWRELKRIGQEYLTAVSTALGKVEENIRESGIADKSGDFDKASINLSNAEVELEKGLSHCFKIENLISLESLNKGKQDSKVADECSSISTQRQNSSELSKKFLVQKDTVRARKYSLQLSKLVLIPYTEYEKTVVPEIEDFIREKGLLLSPEIYSDLKTRYLALMTPVIYELLESEDTAVAKGKLEHIFNNIIQGLGDVTEGDVVLSGLRSYTEGRFDEVIKNLSTVIEKIPATRFIYARSLHQNGDMDKAIEIYAKLVSETESDALTHMYLCEALTQRKKSDDLRTAMVHGKKAIDLNKLSGKKLALAHNIYGIALYTSGYWDRGVKECLEAVRLDQGLGRNHPILK